MLIRFAISNFLSFNQLQEFNMLAGPFKIHPDHVHREKDGFNILKTATIYGANGSGKTNFIHAVSFLQDLVVNGTSARNESLLVPYFKLSKNGNETPTTFQIEFKSQQVYQYFISIIDGRIAEETLHIYYTASSKKKFIFERQTDIKGKNKLKVNGDLIKSQKDRIKLEIFEEELRPNQPFLTEGYNRRVESLQDAYSWFEETLNIVLPESSFGGLVKRMATEPKFYETANRLMKYANASISELSVSKIEFDSLFSIDEEKRKSELINTLKGDKERIAKIHGKEGVDYDVYLNQNGEPEAFKLIIKRKSEDDREISFDLYEESAGTQRYIDLIPALVHTSSESKVYLIDEIDRNIHPILLHDLMKEFLSSNQAGSKGQLIFSTHESSLLNLDLFRQDEIWFTEMDPKNGSTELYSLSDFKPRYDLDIEKGYLQGKFGGIPFISQTNLF